MPWGATPEGRISVRWRRPDMAGPCTRSVSQATERAHGLNRCTCHGALTQHSQAHRLWRAYMAKQAHMGPSNFPHVHAGGRDRVPHRATHKQVQRDVE